MPATAATNVPHLTSPPITIRPAKAEDCDVIARMIRALATYQGVAERVTAKVENLRRDGFGPDRKFEALIAETNGHPVGLAIFQSHYSSWEGATSLQITDLFVDETVRGTGVGFRLVVEVGSIARERGCAGLQLNMVHANPSRTTLDRMGFMHQDDLLHYRLDAAGLKKLMEMER
ncbi:MAG: GNAT family N-acetyltransferase [Alphaproteobacteria bacterium]|nr:GNAT family N-acetyltransferase [Alphaproteobacteria bacterium]